MNQSGVRPQDFAVSGSIVDKQDKWFTDCQHSRSGSGLIRYHDVLGCVHV